MNLRRIKARHCGPDESVALEVAEQGITVNAICPGYGKTDLMEEQITNLAVGKGVSTDEITEDILREKLPTPRFVKTSEVAAVAVFLCSDAAASITGTLLPVDGGWTAQ